MKSVVFLVLLGLTLGQDCPTYTCGALDSGVCASESDSVITVNEDGCDLDEVCSLSLAVAYFATNSDSEYECISSSSTSVDDFLDHLDSISELDNGSDWAESDYCKSDSGKDLKDDSFPKECEDDSDCELNDGTEASCVCTLSGKGYCVPELSSPQAYADWYELCVDEDANDVYYTYYYTHNNLYSWIVDYDEEDSDYDCLENVVYEFSAWRQSQDEYDEEEDNAIYRVAIGALLALVVLA